MSIISFGALRQLSFDMPNHVGLKEVRRANEADRYAHIPFAAPSAFQRLVLGIAVPEDRDRWNDPVTGVGVRWLIEDEGNEFGQRWVTTAGLPLAILGGLDGLPRQNDDVNSPDVRAEVLRIVDGVSPYEGFHGKIQAIKFIRTKFHLGLKEAKDLVDGIVADHGTGRSPLPTPGSFTPLSSVD